MGKIKVGIVGVGNCASALVQGVEYFKTHGSIVGVARALYGQYSLGDIEFVSAFDVDRDKIGKDLAEAIFAGRNCCYEISRAPEIGTLVHPGPVLDGVAPHMVEHFRPHDQKPINVAKVLKETDTEILVNFLPVGSREATRYYAQAALDAGCAFINCIPEFIASGPSWAKRFQEAGLPVAGDDIKSQIGATIVHRTLVGLLHERGAIVDRTYQLNIGGNTDFLNMIDESRLHSKRISKTEAIKSVLDYDLPMRVGPSDYVEYLGDRKIAYISIEGRGFGGVPLSIELKLSVEDSPNSAGVVVNAIRGTKIAMDLGISGALANLSARYFKHPPLQVGEQEAKRWIDEFLQSAEEPATL